MSGASHPTQGEETHDAKADAIECADHFWRQLLPIIMAAYNYEDIGCRVAWWAALFAGLLGACAAHVGGRERADAVLAMVKQMMDTTPLGEEKH